MKNGHCVSRVVYQTQLKLLQFHLDLILCYLPVDSPSLDLREILFLYAFLLWTLFPHWWNLVYLVVDDVLNILDICEADLHTCRFNVHIDYILYHKSEVLFKRQKLVKRQE